MLTAIELSARDLGQVSSREAAVVVDPDFTSIAPGNERPVIGDVRVVRKVELKQNTVLLALGHGDRLEHCRATTH